MMKQVPTLVDILILGAGWTSTFLIPLITNPKRSAEDASTCLPETALTYAATTTTSRPDILDRPTIPFVYDPSSDSLEPFARLPPATTVLITFPLTGTGPSAHLVQQYRRVHGPANRFIQLGSTGVFADPLWNTHASPCVATDPRAVAEDELINSCAGVVLNLAGLYGGARDPRDWLMRVATTKAAVKGKKALHLIHGVDVARGILGVHFAWDKATGQAAAQGGQGKGKGKRWLLTDLRVYDWWDLAQTWGPEAAHRHGEDKQMIGEEAPDLRYAEWVGELMQEEGVRALPRAADTLGRVLDSRDFWNTVGVWPIMGRVMS